MAIGVHKIFASRRKISPFLETCFHVWDVKVWCCGVAARVQHGDAHRLGFSGQLAKLFACRLVASKPILGFFLFVFGGFLHLDDSCLQGANLLVLTALVIELGQWFSNLFLKSYLGILPSFFRREPRAPLSCVPKVAWEVAILLGTSNNGIHALVTESTHWGANANVH